MLEKSVKDLLRSSRGAIEAPAGTGKTEQVARGVASLPGRWLVLTHTVAGVDAIRKRLGSHSVPEKNVTVDTISAWAYRWASAYPTASQLPQGWTPRNRDWTIAHRAATTLIVGGALVDVLTASYVGVFVDEYQDCSLSQHALVLALSEVMKCYIFGDPLQAIFGFSKDDALANWGDHTLTAFPLAGTLPTPHRWDKVNNGELGHWLLSSRAGLLDGRIDLTTAPPCVRWTQVSANAAPHELGKLCNVAGQQIGETLVVLDSSKRATRRADLARSIGGTTLEPVAGKCERYFYEALANTTGMARVDAVLDFAAAVLTGADAAAKRKRVENILSKPGTQRKLPTECELSLCSVANGLSLVSIIDSFAALEREHGIRVVRPELLSSVKAALQLANEDAMLGLEDASWEVANARRQRGRVVRNRSVGSTLLVKGLEFDHVVITPAACSTRYEWYVALTRGTRTVHVLSPLQKFRAD